MIRINLLPHREEKRKARRQQFYVLLGLVSVLAAVIWFLGFSVVNRQIAVQNEKNEFLNRTETVHLFNELAKQVPEGIYLRSLVQTGPKIAISGYAQSNARITTLMNNLDESPLLEQSTLIETKSEAVANRRLNAFSITTTITRQTAAPTGKK
jgi:type IV pilus assembly protein PilN